MASVQQPLPTIEDFTESGVEKVLGITDDECAICLEALSEPIRTIACQHVLDRSCLLTWLSDVNGSGTCPVCRHPLVRTNNASLSRIDLEGIRQLLRSTSFVEQDFGIDSSEDDLPSLDNININLGVFSSDDVTMVVRASRAATPLVLSGNMMLAAAQLSDMPFLGMGLERFQKTIQAMWEYIQDEDGNTVNVAEFPGEILHGTVLKMIEQGFDVGEMEVFMGSAINGQCPGQQILQVGIYVSYMLLLSDREQGGDASGQAENSRDQV